MDSEKQFVEGIFVERPSENAPEFIKAKLSVKPAELMPFLEKHVNNAGFVNLDLKESKAGKLYLEVNSWKPEKPESIKETPDDIPW